MRVLFLTTEAFQQQCQILPHVEELVISMEHVRYCKIESYKNATIGVIRIPETVGKRKKNFIFGCYLTEHDIIFLEEENELYQCWNGMYEHLEEVENPFQYLLMMLEELVATDIYNLQKIEKKMNGFEEELLKEKELPFFDFFMKTQGKRAYLIPFTHQIHPFSIFQALCRMKLLHLLLLLFDHLSHHLTTDGTCLTGREISVIAIL